MSPVSVRANLTGSDRFKIGLFSLNASGGIAMTKVPERWQAQWDDIARVAQLAEEHPFDHDGEFFTVRGAHCLPRCLQEGGPVLMSAAFTQTGREFAAKYCDVLFTTISNIENGKRHVESLREASDCSGRRL